MGIAKIIPNNNEEIKQAKNPPKAKPSLFLIAPQIAGIAPIIAPPIIAPKTADKVKESINTLHFLSSIATLILH